MMTDTEFNRNGLLYTWAGMNQGFTDGPASTGQFSHPYDLVVDSLGNFFLTDFNNNCIRKLTPDGHISTIAGHGNPGFSDGFGSAATFNRPRGIAIAKDDNIYVADTMNHKIRKVTPEGYVTTIAGSIAGDEDGPAFFCKIRYPRGVAVAPDGTIYISDSDNNKIKKITTSGFVETIAGSIKGDSVGDALKEAKFNIPHGLLIVGEEIIVTDTHNNKIKKIQLLNGAGHVVTLTGSHGGFEDGKCENALFQSPYAVKIDPDNNIIVADYSNNRVRKITEDGYVFTIVGNGSHVVFQNPTGLCLDPSGVIVVADTYNHRLRKIIPKDKLADSWPDSHHFLCEQCSEAIIELLCIANSIYQPTFKPPKEILQLLARQMVYEWLNQLPEPNLVASLLEEDDQVATSDEE